MSSSLGMMKFHFYMEKTIVPNHQPGFFIGCSSITMFIAIECRVVYWDSESLTHPQTMRRNDGKLLRSKSDLTIKHILKNVACGGFELLTM